MFFLQNTCTCKQTAYDQLVLSHYILVVDFLSPYIVVFVNRSWSLSAEISLLNYPKSRSLLFLKTATVKMVPAQHKRPGFSPRCFTGQGPGMRSVVDCFLSGRSLLSDYGAASSAEREEEGEGKKRERGERAKREGARWSDESSAETIQHSRTLLSNHRSHWRASNLECDLGDGGGTSPTFPSFSLPLSSSVASVRLPSPAPSCRAAMPRTLLSLFRLQRCIAPRLYVTLWFNSVGLQRNCCELQQRTLRAIMNSVCTFAIKGAIYWVVWYQLLQLNSLIQTFRNTTAFNIQDGKST